jgi:hypothetical protein
MPVLETGRHNLPLLAVTQAQKEITHNEALVLIDALLHKAVEGVALTAPADRQRYWQMLVGGFRGDRFMGQ